MLLPEEVKLDKFTDFHPSSYPLSLLMVVNVGDLRSPRHLRRSLQAQ